MHNIIEIDGLDFTYASGRTIFKNFSMALPDNLLLGLSGPNGAGKTTLLQLIMGLEKLQGGTIRLLGQVCRAEADFKPLRPKLGYLFQDPDDQLFSPTVLEDAAFGPLNMGLKQKEAKAKALASLELAGIAHLQARVCYTLSGGEKKLAALAGILALDPVALLLDEPSAGLSEDSTRDVAALIKKLSLPGIVVSHDRAFLQAVGASMATVTENGLE